MAQAKPRVGRAKLLGLPTNQFFCAERAARANSTAVRELGNHEAFPAANDAHRADHLPPLLAVAQQCGCSRHDPIRAIATAYDVHVAFVKGTCLHEHKIDHIAHVRPSVAAGLGTLLRLPAEITYEAIQQALIAPSPPDNRARAKSLP